MRRAITLISEIDAFCAERFPDHFAGIAPVGPDLERPESVVVYRRPLAAFDAAVRGRFPQLSSILRFVDADYSRERLMALGRRVVDDAARSSGWGVTRSEISPAADGSAVEVVLADADGPTRALLSRRYGPPVVIAGGAATPTMPSGDMDAGGPLRHSHAWRLAQDVCRDLPGGGAGRGVHEPARRRSVGGPDRARRAARPHVSAQERHVPGEGTSVVASGSRS